MQNISENALEASTAQSTDVQGDGDDSVIKPLTPSKRVELWSGRFAMVGFATTVAAIAFRGSI